MIDIPNYQIVEEIGQGGMAKVYKAKHKHLSKKPAVAIKIMSTRFSSLPTFQECFHKEAETLDEFTHDHILQIHDMGVVTETTPQLYYIIMEYLAGGTLQEKLTQQGTLPLKETLRILQDLAKALDSVHQKGFIHRDIKPANIMFRDSGEVVLTDFGIAKLEGTTGALTQMNLGAGSANYMAPEQLKGSKVDQRIDIYSLGIVWYEMLVGQKPFVADNTSAMLYQHIHAEIPQLPKKYSQFQPVLEKAMAKKPSDRYHSATEFVTAIQKTAAQTKTKPTTPPNQPPTSKPQRYKSLIWLFLMAILASGGYFLYKTLMPPPVSIEKPPTITSTPPTKPEPAIPETKQPSEPECSFTDRLNGKC